MSAAYSPEGWGEFFICSGGAAAALSGLIFVALSVNLGRVFELDKASGAGSLIGRALEALVALLNVLVISIVGLTPSIARGALAAFIIVVAAESAISPVRAIVARVTGPRPSEPAYALPIRLGLASGLTASLVVGGITYQSQVGGGLWWLPVAFVLAITVAAVNAWVLLVEIHR